MTSESVPKTIFIKHVLELILISLQELLLPNTRSSNQKSSRSVDPQFPQKLLLYLRVLYNKYFHWLMTRKDKNTRLPNSKFRFARIISNYANLGALDVNNRYCLQIWVGTDTAFHNNQFSLHHYKITKMLRPFLWAISLNWITTFNTIKVFNESNMT